jgi:hypothetical protein
MHLSIRCRRSCTPWRAQLGGQLDVVEDFAVLHHSNLAVVGHKGLVAAAQIDDGQAPVAQCHPALRLVDADVVGAAVSQLARHDLQRRVTQRAVASGSSRRFRTYQVAFSV